MRIFVTFLIAIGLIVLVFILILKGFGSGSKNQVLPKPITSYATTNAIAELTLDGPVNYNGKHLSVQINIDQYQTQINIIQGYQGQVTNTQAYPNNQNAYAVFLRSIGTEGFMNGNPDSTITDDRGICPFGNRYVYQLVDGSQTIERYWSTSCGSQGSFKGNSVAVNSLFKAQIPNYN